MKSREGILRLKRFQADETRRRVVQIEAMIADFERMAKDLEDQIHAEQERSGIRDAAHFAYPTFAKAAAQRRDNLMASVGELRDQLAAAQDDHTGAVEELKKSEALVERDLGREFGGGHDTGTHGRAASAMIR
jgi:flagellar export protein FliJ